VGNMFAGYSRKEISAAIAKQLLEPSTKACKITPDMRRVDVIAMKLVNEGLAGNLAAIREIMDRVEGKPVQAISGPDDGPVQTEVALSRETLQALARKSGLTVSEEKDA